MVDEAKVSDKNVSVTENDIRRDQVRAGWLGKIFGSNEHVSTYIAALVVTVLLGLAGIIIFFPPANMTTKELLQWLGTPLGVALGFLFGKRELKG